MKKFPVIAALIATCNRPALLARRALPSVAAQKRRPDFVVVVDDSMAQFRKRNRQTVEQFANASGIRALYLENTRNKGASGAWNTGALAILNESRDASRAYIAILDDDDEWLPGHLAQAEKAARRGADLIAVPFLRREPKIEKTIYPPELLKGSDFLVGNPGVGCGTLIIRLPVFCRAGMFDEAMPACTDRDICFRISLLGKISYRPAKEISAVHYADANRGRLSNRLGKTKLKGLSAFADKYRCWMGNAEFAAFHKRAKKLFGWQPPGGDIALSAARSSLPKIAKHSGKTDNISLVIGVIVPPNEKDNPLFSDIAKLSADKRLSSLNVIVMPSSGAYAENLRREAEKWRGMGLRIHCISGAHASEYINNFSADSGKPRSIPVNRTVLQHAVFRIARHLRNPVCWILDGDVRLRGTAIRAKTPAQFKPDYIGEMLRLRDTGCDVAIGGINGAAPLPRASTARAQMTDLLFCLAGLARNGEKNRPKNTIAAMPTASISEDYYYDYGANPHLEQPAGILSFSGADFIKALPNLLNRILAGDAVTRPLLHFPDAAQNKIPHRGGNTLVFNPQTFRACPNILAPGDGFGMRRMDEIWRLVGETALGWKVSGGNFPVTQSRENEPPQAPDIDRMAADIAGHAVSAVLRKIAGKKRFSGVQSLVDFILDNDFEIFAEMENAARQRLLMARASFYRICGIAESMRGLLGSEKNAKAAAAALKKMEARFSRKNFSLLEKRAMKALNRAKLKEDFSQYPEFCKTVYRLKIAYAWVAKEQRKNAAALVEKIGVLKSPARFIGQGREGTVFTDGNKVCKILHNWHSRAGVCDPNFIISRRVKEADFPQADYPIIGSKRNKGDLALLMPYKKTLPYRGGHGAAVVAMLADFRRRGICLWNIDPNNMRFLGKKLLFIDYGKDIKPLTEKDFDLSARRAWLCCKWGWRSDLSALLSAALETPDLPELSGYENMKKAAMQYAKEFRLCHTLIGDVLSRSPKRVFDFGCGKNPDAITLAKKGIYVCAYDPEISEKTRRKYAAAGVNVLEYNQLAGAGTFDVVILRDVICEIFSGAKLRQCLSNVRRLAGERGKVIITACDVGGIAENTCASNKLPGKFDICQKFLYRKELRKNGAVRPHIHRPEDVLLREFARAGLKAESRKAFPDIDLNRFAPGGGSLQWTLTPMPPSAPVSLVIRACAMDSDIVESQTRHLVRQLSFPRGFAEIILAVDNRAQNFLREHRAGDLAELFAAAEKMRQCGVIDRVIIPPQKREKEKMRKLNRLWAGIDSDFTHAQNGAPLSVVFAAFEQCKTPYALHIDIDMIAGRADENHDYLGEMVSAMEKTGAATMSLDIPGATGVLLEQKENSFRLEVRAGLTNIKKLKTLRPLPFTIKNGIPAEGWHRAADVLLRGKNLPSLRGGDQRLFAFHPPNEFKDRNDALDAVFNAAERGVFPEEQRGQNEWNGLLENWLPPPRREEFIFVICGRNVDGGGIERCLNSVERQKNRNWGAVIMDDASAPECAARLKQWADRHPTKTTYFARRRRVGGLPNLIFAVRRLCGNPQSVIVTLDMDDALYGETVLCRLADEYRRGADLTAGSMLRSDKQAAYPVCFKNPYKNRGGNVWQHLRSFRKPLFDAIPDIAMRDSNGKYFSLAEDWAYMLPMVKMAKHPVWIKDILYLYEPNPAKKNEPKHPREAEIAEIIKRSPLIRKGKK